LASAGRSSQLRPVLFAGGSDGVDPYNARVHASHDPRHDDLAGDTTANGEDDDRHA